MTPKDLKAYAAAMREGGVSRLVLPHKDGAVVIECFPREAPAPSSATRLQNAKPRPTEALRNELEEAVPPELRKAGVDADTFAEVSARAHALNPD